MYGMTRVASRSPAYGLSSNYSSGYNTMPVTRKPPPYNSYTPSTYNRKKSDYSSTTYTSNYGTSRSRTPSATRNQSPSRDDRYEDLERRTRALVTSPKTRPLPRGPGTRDKYGALVDEQEHLKSLRSNLKRNSSLSRDVGVRRPVKVDYSGSLDRDRDTPRYRSVDRDVGGSRLTRAKRAGSVADITNRFEDLHTTSPTALKNSKRFGSTADLNGSYVSSPSPRTSVEDSSSPSLSYGKHTRTTSLNSYNDTSTLPDINVSNKSSRSSSIDGREYTNRKKSDLENDLISSSSTITKRQYGKSRQNSNVSLSSCTSNGISERSSPDSNNNNKGVVGLRNIGNTCFMNSVLQCLSNTKPLLEYCLEEEYKNTVNTRTSSMKGQLIKVFASVMKSLWKNNSESYVTPSDFKNQIARFAKRFVGYNQQDAQEFLIYLLEGLHEDINRVQEKKKRIIDDCNEVETIGASEKAKLCWNRYIDIDNSKIVELCVGQLRSALTCTVCDYVSNTFDPFWDLSLPIGKSRTQINLTDCFDLFTQEEILDGDERPTCAKCKKRQQCQKRLYIQKFPKVLIIHLKRFNQGSYYRSKLSTMVDFPLEGLDLTSYSAENRVRAVYNLYAVSNHSGSTGGGHYTAYAKNPYTGDWHHFNDQRVTKISTRSVVSSEAYVLFYELQGSPSHL